MLHLATLSQSDCLTADAIYRRNWEIIGSDFVNGKTGVVKYFYFRSDT